MTNPMATMEMGPTLSERATITDGTEPGTLYEFDLEPGDMDPRTQALAEEGDQFEMTLSAVADGAAMFGDDSVPLETWNAVFAPACTGVIEPEGEAVELAVPPAESDEEPMPETQQALTRLLAAIHEQKAVVADAALTAAHAKAASKLATDRLNGAVELLDEMVAGLDRERARRPDGFDAESPMAKAADSNGDAEPDTPPECKEKPC